MRKNNLTGMLGSMLATSLVAANQAMGLDKDAAALQPNGLFAFAIANLAPGGGKRKRSPTLWLYRTADAVATINTAGYFNNASNLLDIGDVIIGITVDDVDTPTSVAASAIYLVLSNAAGVVDVSDGTALAVTDSD